MSDLYQNSIQGFLNEEVRSGEIHFLVSGTLQELSDYNGSKYIWDTETWHHYQVDSEGNWTEQMEGAEPDNGSFKEKAYLVGIAVSGYASGSKSKELTALEQCSRLKMNLQIGEIQQDFDLKIQSRELRNGFVFFSVAKVPLPGNAKFPVFFKYKGDEYKGYTCYAPEKDRPDVVVSLFPYTPPVESEEYNPTLNNTMEDVPGTIARIVESFEEQNDSFGKIYYERATRLADIPDSFYSSLANISGRWLGTKNAEYHIYLGEKLEFTARNIEECKQDIQQNANKGVYLVYQGSPFVLRTADSTSSITSGLEGTVTGIMEEGTLTGEVQGTISGSVSGLVAGINLNAERITNYSSSILATGHVIWGQGNIVGSGTIYYENWKSLEKEGNTITVGSNYGMSGLTHLDGNYSFIESDEQETAVQLVNVFGNIQTDGQLEGAGRIRYMGSEETVLSRESQYLNPNYLYLVNADVSSLEIDTITSGTLKVMSSGSVYISGTVGNIADKFNLTKFIGTFNIQNNTPQTIQIEHADSDGITLTNVETAEESSTTFNSFTADTITTVQNFGGRAGFALTGGKLNVASNGIMYISLVTEDQEDITGSEQIGTDAKSVLSTGSLPNGVRFFMEAEPVGQYLDPTPTWNFSAVRQKIVTKVTGSEILKQDSLAEGTALLSGSFKDFTVQGTRKNLRLYNLLPVSESRIRKTDIQQATKMLADLEAGLSFAQQAFSRPLDANDTSSVTPRIVSRAVLPQQVYDSMVTASQYIVSGTDGQPIWINEAGSVSRNFDFFDPANRESVQRFITGSVEAITRLNTFLSSSKLDQFARKQSGQYTYVYLVGTGIEYLEADVRSFSGSYIDSRGHTGSLFYEPLTGSFRQIWGRFGEGSIVRKEVNLRSGSVLESSLFPGDSHDFRDNFNRWPVSSEASRERTGNINGVIYGAFDFKGYVNGGYEGNMVEGTIEGGLSGVVSGLINTGSIRRGSAQLLGISRGTFTGAVKAGTFEGAMKNVSISGNNLTDNLYFEGQIEGAEEFPLDGILSGSVKNLVLPGQCTYQITGSSLNGQELNLNIPEAGTMTGQLITPGHSPLGLDLTGASISVSSSHLESFSGNVEFGPSGTILLSEGVNMPTGSGWEETSGSSESNVTGQFKLTGSFTVTTPEASLFSGEISTIPVNQQVSGSFSASIQSPTFLKATLDGRLDNFKGHALVRGLVTPESGVKGNLVEGYDRPFFTFQRFSGSVFPADTTLDAVQNMNLSDMVLENLKFTSGMALLPYSTGSFGTVKEQEYVQNTLTLPKVGDIIYTSAKEIARVVSSKVYCSDLNALLTINDQGTVIEENYLTQIQ